MSETLALNRKAQSKFARKVKNVKGKVDKGIIKVKENIKKRKLKPVRGLIYLGHIPHGFYEQEMKQYFKQFGAVTNVKVCRSKNTGHSKGYGFVEFREPEVAQIAAETMDNYLMFNRRLICKYIPPEKQRRNLFMKTEWSAKYYPLKISRKMHIRKRNRNPSNEEFTVKTTKMINKLKQKMDKLMKLGVKHTFTPSDVPDDMMHLLKTDKETNSSKMNINSEFNKSTLEKTNDILKGKRTESNGFIITDIPVTDLCKEFKNKSLKTIRKKKDKLRDFKIPKISFMENERLKRLAAAEILKEAIVKKVDKLKKTRIN